MRRALLVAAVAGLSGCVYYNGMYNARRLSSAAEKAEREGRTIDANTYWSQVTVKAETLVARHPDSKLVPEAELLAGRAYARLNSCTQARPMLERSLPRVADSVLIDEGRFALAKCQAALGDHAEAIASLRALADRGPAERRRSVRLALARSLRLSGSSEEAITVLAGVQGKGSDAERVVAFADAGRAAATLALADTLIAAGDTAVLWDSAVVGLARTDPAAASLLLDRILPIGNSPPERQAQRLLDDASRLAAVDSVRMRARLAQAAEVGRQTGSGARARLELIRARLAAADELADLDSASLALGTEADASPLAAELATLHAVVTRVRAADTLNALTPQGDLRLFLAAEAARDSLHARLLAAELFRRVSSTWPASPYAPKALLAAARLVPAPAEARALLEERYAGSPYLAVARGEDASALQALEDSLGAFARAQFTVSRVKADADSAGPARGRPARPPAARPAPTGRTVELQ